MMPGMTSPVEEALRRVGRMNDDAIDIAEAGLMLAAIDCPDAPLDTYRDHLRRRALPTYARRQRHCWSITMQLEGGGVVTHGNSTRSTET